MTRRTLLIYLVTSLLVGSEGSYDEYLTCDRLYETRRTARVLDHVPCDMRKQSYCEHKGSAYPEHAIWRFKEENKALMKRMYGDVDSSEVYREMRSNSMFREERASSFAVNMIPFNDNMFNGLNYNIRVGSGLSVVKNAKEEKVRIRLGNTRTRARGTTTSTTEGTGVVTTTTTTSSSRVTTTQSVTATESIQTNAATTIQPSTATELPTLVTQMTEPADTVTPPQLLPASTVSHTLDPALEPRPVSEMPQMATEQAAGAGAIAIAEDTLQTETVPALQTEAVSSSTDLPRLNLPEGMVAEDREADQAGLDLGEPLLPAEALKPSESEWPKVEARPDMESYAEAMQATLTDLRPAQIEAILPGDDVESLAKVEAADGVMEDGPAKEEEEDIEEDDSGLIAGEGDEDLRYQGESINACPVNEEVKAPFWANNTRNQVLALLNLYPFEQYIHMETCQHEYKEMLCRPGCRCEQQYRLHRLLAFDPNNECRGIFSDWFRFPSFCVCKCYSVPEQLVADLARNPRKSEFSPARARQQPKQNRPVASSAAADNDRLDNHRMSKKTRLFVDHEMGIPAVFPYEGRAAIMAELSLHQGPSEEDQSAEWSGEAASRPFLSLNNDRAATAEPLKDRYRGAAAPATVPLLAQLEGLEAAAAVAADGHIDNTVESEQLHYRKSNKEARQLDEHFFYNQPIVEFRLPDGTEGKVHEKIPRRK